MYVDHSEITDIPLAFWTLGEIKHFAHNKVKREDAMVEKEKEKSK